MRKILKKIPKKVVVAIAFVVVITTIVAIPKNKPLEKMNAGEALNREIKLQTEKQEALDLIDHLDEEILKTRKHRNKMHKSQVCRGSGCYISSF